MIIEIIINPSLELDQFISDVKEIDDGNYQGTKILYTYVDRYQPFASDYIMTYVKYGSCNVCDAIERALSDYKYNGEELAISDLMTICLHMIQHLVIPFGDGEDWE